MNAFHQARNHPQFADYAACLGLSFIWAAMIWVVNPRGEFPLNDDWMYARSVYEWVNTKRYVLCDFQAATAFTQFLWGVLFSSIFGFSMNVLRASVLVLGWLGLLLSYGFFRKSNQRAGLCFFAAVVTATSPFYFILSNTFMTNIPFYFCTMAAVLLLFDWLEREKRASLAGGVLFACLAILSRQLAMLIPAAFAVAAVVRGGITKKTIGAGLVCGLAVWGTLFFYHECLRQTVGIPVMDTVKAQVVRITIHLAKNGYFVNLALAFLFRAVSVLSYLGVFLFPLLVIFHSAVRGGFSLSRRWLAHDLAAAVFIVFSLWILFFMKKMMPLFGVYIFDFGVGPLTIDGGGVLPKAPPLFWLGVTVLGLLGGALLMGQIADEIAQIAGGFFRKKSIKHHAFSVFCLTACVVHFIPFGFTGHFDLYLVAYLPFMIFFLLVRLPQTPFRPKMFACVISGCLVVGLLYFSLAGTHDYLSWNRARWKGLVYLMQHERVPAPQIDGGYEFNGWFLYDPEYKKIPGRAWWWVQDDRYLISFAPRKAGYEPYHAIPYGLWLPPWKGTLFIQKRIQERVERDFSNAKTVYDR